jgi:hypothetical protein
LVEILPRRETSCHAGYYLAAPLVCRRVTPDPAVGFGSNVYSGQLGILSDRGVRCRMNDLGILALRRVELLEDRQDDTPTRPAYGAAEGLVILRGGAGAEINVEGHTVRSCGDQTINDSRVISARPWPAIQRLQTSRIYFNNDNFLARLTLQETESKVGKTEVERREKST